jgi:hypothetical protein
MAIRFYCPYCEKLLGISARKAGAVVDCPNCRGKVGVPAENARSEALVIPKNALATSERDQAAGAAGVVLSVRQVWIVCGAIVAMLGMAFLVGLVLGRLF